MTEQERIAAGIARGATELGYLSNDYMIHRERQQLERWQSRFTLLSRDIAACVLTGRSRRRWYAT